VLACRAVALAKAGARNRSHLLKRRSTAALQNVTDIRRAVSRFRFLECGDSFAI